MQQTLQTTILKVLAFVALDIVALIFWGVGCYYCNKYNVPVPYVKCYMA